MSGKNRRNYYRLLHVQPDAPLEVIKSSYRTMMLTLKLHPDLGGDEWDASLINEAYAVLSDGESRARYDRQVADLKKKGGAGASQRASTEVAVRPPASSRAHTEPVPSAPSGHVEPVEPRICTFCRAPNAGRLSTGDERCRACCAPLSLVELTVRESDRRAVERIDYRTSMSYRMERATQAAEPGLIVDLSPTGLQFLCPRRLSVGCVLKIDSPTLSAVATVTRIVHDKATGHFATGVQFLTLALARPRGTFVSTRA